MDIEKFAKGLSLTQMEMMRRDPKPEDVEKLIIEIERLRSCFHLIKLMVSESSMHYFEKIKFTELFDAALAGPIAEVQDQVMRDSEEIQE